MKRALHLGAILTAATALSGCGHLHAPYLPHDGPFSGRAESGTAAADRIDPVQTSRGAVAGVPPCKFGGSRCPPWERAWPASPGIPPADKVTDAGEVIPAKAGAH